MESISEVDDEESILVILPPKYPSVSEGVKKDSP